MAGASESLVGIRSMWSVSNLTPFAVARSWGRDRDGIHEWIIAVKGTFDIMPDGNLKLADEQIEPRLLPEFHGEDGLSSLRYEADLVSPKPTTDIIINGTAYAPKGVPSKEFQVSARVGPIRKAIKVVGNRTWERKMLGLAHSAMEPVTRVPIVYERAYGGFDDADPDPRKQRLDARNPVGCGLVIRPGLPLPNFEYPDGKLEKAGPAGFGAIASYWSPRRELQGTYDEDWKRDRYPLLPADWDPKSLLCSPADQRPGEPLLGGEPVELLNLTPDGSLRFVLPKVALSFRTKFSRLFGRRTEGHEAGLATVIIEPDHPRLIMLWSGCLLYRGEVDYLDETIVSGKYLT